MKVDAAVIGAGVVGCAIARELTAHGLQVLLIESSNDVGTGTSKANTAIWHTGFDAKPGTLEAELVARGHRLLAQRGEHTGWPLERIGAVLVAWSNDELGRLAAVQANAIAVGYHALQPLTVDELRAREPHLGPGVRGGLLVPDEGLLDPWTITISLATEAVINGATLWTNSPVTSIIRIDQAFAVRCGNKDVETRWIVNAAGLNSDVIDALLGYSSFTVTPRRGQLVVYDKLARSLVTHIVLPVPTPTTKGVLVAPTIYGNLMVGPTAEDLTDKSATQTTGAGLQTLVERGRQIVPALADEEVTATYAGLRAATEHRDYCYDVFDNERYVRVGGIRSTGVSSALAIAEKVAGDLANAGERLSLRDDFVSWSAPDLSEASRNSESRTRVDDPATGTIVCHCERVSRAEIDAAFASPIPPVDADGLKRRTRAQMGRCQGFYCGAAIAAMVPTRRADQSARV